jgi:hypothetical protein
MTRHKRKEIELYYRMGWQCSMITLCPIGTIVLVYTGHINLLLGFLGMCLILGLMNPVILGGHTMKTIKRLLGITAVNGKLEALAKHMKVRFNLIPEHYECEKVS